MNAKGNSSRMLGRSSILCIGLSILAGCGSHDEPKPQIVRSPASSEPVVVQPKKRVVKGTPYDQPVDRNIPSDWLPPPGEERRWKAIVLHHSGTNNGNAAIFDRWHREGNHWEGVGYDFVIGNGTDSGDGQVEVTFRWRQQRTGAHCKTPTNWANESAVGICLVGNFNHTAPTSRQMQSLLRLIRFLQKRYDISRRQVYGHNTTPGARATDCPGKKFPMARLKSMLGA